MAGFLRIPRSRGGISGLLLILLGIWGGLVPFVGPYFHYAYSPDRAWVMTSGRLYLEVLPAAGAILAGLIVLGSKLRPVATAGALLGIASGAWFVVGGTLATIWSRGTTVAQGHPLGGTVVRAVEQIGFFTGLGVAIAVVAGLALGRLSVIAVRDAVIAGRHAAAVSEPPAIAEAPAGRPGMAEAPAGHPGVTKEPARSETAGTSSADAEPAAAEPTQRETTSTSAP